MIPARDLISDLFAEKTRILLTILAITWGSFTITTMLATGEGLRITFITAVKNAGHNLLSVNAGSTSKTYYGIPPNQSVPLKKADFKAIQRLPPVERISPGYSLFTTLKYRQKKVSQTVLAVNSSFADIHNILIKPGGRFISPIDMQKKQNVIVLGTKTADELFSKWENPVGQTITVAQHPFIIIGVMKDKPQLVATQSPDTYLNWIPASYYQTLANPLTINSISITYKENTHLAALKKQIRKIIALNHHVDPGDKSIVNFSDVENQQKKITTFFIGMQIFLGIIGALTLLVAAVGIANVMYASINRATHEIGIRMAIGARTYHILLYYIAESLLTTFIGGILGIFFSALLVYTVSIIPMQGSLIKAIGKPTPILSPLVIVLVIAVLGLTGLLAGLFPALKASRIDPSEALSYE